MGLGQGLCSSLASERGATPDTALHTTPKHLGQHPQLRRAETLTLHPSIKPSQWWGWGENSQEDASEKPQTVAKMGSALNLAFCTFSQLVITWHGHLSPLNPSWVWC